MGKNNQLKIAYLAFSEEFNASHAGFVHTHNIVKEVNEHLNVSLFIKIKQNQRTIEDFETINVSDLKPKHLLTNPLRFIKKFSEIKTKLREFDVIHERFSVNPTSYFLLKENNAKYVLEMNDPGIETWQGIRKLLYAPLIKLKLKKCNAIITQTETLKKIISKHTKKPIHVISNGVSLNEFNINKKIVEKERKKHVKQNQPLVTFIGSFREWHGVLEIPFIAKHVLKEYKNTKFLLVGKGKEFKVAEELVKEKDLEQNVILLGNVDSKKISLLLKASDICIAPFNTKKFSQIDKHGFWWSPLKLFEYLAAGKPIVSYEFKEIRNIVQGSALLAEKNNVKEFSENILKLIKSNLLREKLAEKARLLAKNHSWKNKALQTIEVYKNIE